MIALADCNNFYVSCERVFNPKLKGRPVVVLSNNDGCIISRSNEAKKLGIKMGEPVFKIRDLVERYNVELFSTNFALYGDMSSRVMQLIGEFSPQIEVYSIDEAFIDFRGIKEPHTVAASLSNNIQKSTGIPISIGIAKTKTLAKAANSIAKKEKKDGIYLLDGSENIRKRLESFPLSEVWGIGPRSAAMLNSYNIYSAYDFMQLNEKWVLKNMSITGLKLNRELNGENCFDLDKYPRSKKSISSSRTFPIKTDDFEYISRHISRNASRCAQKLRMEKCCAGLVGVVLQTSPHDKKQRYYQFCKTMSIAPPTSDTHDIIKTTTKLLRSTYRENINYSKSKVFLGGFVSANRVQLNLFHKKKDRSKLNSGIDFINSTMGSDTIQMLSDGIEKKQCKDRMSSRFTTKWDELLKIKT